MRIATWNINSAKARQARLIEWLDRAQPDVVCLQETKLDDNAFAENFDEDLFRRGYAYAHHGDGRWNGVALLSRIGLDDVERGLAGGPGFPDPEPRAVAATCGGVRIWSLYVPNGRAPDDPHYAYKLEWLAALRGVLAESAPRQPIMACGDFNIAPTDADVWDPADFVGATHVTEPERSALGALTDLGLVDVLRARWPDDVVYTYWDYRALCFPKNMGMRIDLTLASADVAGRVAAAWVDRAARKGTGTSDHAPVVVDLDTAPDGDVGPMVPPPSSRGSSGRGSSGRGSSSQGSSNRSGSERAAATIRRKSAPSPATTTEDGA
ncbi:exodeoxyribonuclease III [Frankia sp. CNm7]|uniref:Exodeoxyribonuclease III n=1 Tax=Frankia nepalensis TaxID=1836974 RepID=A0A937REI4_9ACTN|nr:exodeoxyribonuclease III [Frankia nepalensis]MBL7495403.1 exodeoxyribonuclease III [Frankia nepalensis]MBL7515093.1 exodeoxyribonuclease III [Frankia nepalensis]MBL7518820.1 exodeoxyribonuclease III [Frankia nepalensis]MBL7625959.1 exodeoxyribonuclease III [Frankia nepalensis]